MSTLVHVDLEHLAVTGRLHPSGSAQYEKLDNTLYVELSVNAFATLGKKDGFGRRDSKSTEPDTFTPRGRKCCCYVIIIMPMLPLAPTGATIVSAMLLVLSGNYGSCIAFFPNCDKPMGFAVSHNAPSPAINAVAAGGGTMAHRVAREPTRVS